MRFSAHKNVSMWVLHVSQLVWSIFTTRIMSWWVNSCVPVKVVISTSSSEERSATGKTHRFWYRSSALIRNLLHQFQRKWPLLLCHYATRTFLACDLVVDVALDQEFLANAAPQRKVHGLILRLAQWNCFRHSNVNVVSWLRLARGDSVSTGPEAWVGSESVTVN